MRNSEPESLVTCAAVMGKRIAPFDTRALQFILDELHLKGRFALASYCTNVPLSIVRHPTWQEQCSRMRQIEIILIACANFAKLRHCLATFRLRLTTRDFRGKVAGWGDRENSRLSTACYCEQTFTVVLYLAYKYGTDDVQKAFCQNVMLGGHSTARGAVLGAILGEFPTHVGDGRGQKGLLTVRINSTMNL